MRRYCGLFLVIFSTIILLNALFMKLGGFGIMMQIGMPIAMALMPLNEDTRVWVDMPLPIGLVARIKAASSVPSPDGSSSVGGGELDVEFDLSMWEEEEPEEGQEPLRLTELILIQETAELDEIQHCQMILTKMNWSTWNFGSGVILAIGILGLLGGILWKVMSYYKTLSKPEQ